MTKRLQLDVTAGPPVVITMVGRIDEGAGLGAAVASLPPGPIVIDTSGVTFINSVGMRDWIRFLRAIRDRGIPTLTNVADVLMTQMNLLGEVRGTLKIVSFHAQYACNACGYEATPLIDAVANAATLAAMKPPEVPCAECHSVMQLADFPERYLTIFQV